MLECSKRRNSTSGAAAEPPVPLSGAPSNHACSHGPAAGPRLAKGARVHIDITERVVVPRSEVERLPGPPTTQRLELANDGSWFRAWPQAVRSLERRPHLRRIVAALLLLHHTRESHGLDVAAAFRAGWPDERCLAAAQRNRVHVAIATLRALGLAHAIVFERGGYRLAPDLDVCAVPTAEPPGLELACHGAGGP